ncbi:MAG: hypothetical protein ACR2NA_09535 [Solirubrobacterales bacterium]
MALHIDPPQSRRSTDAVRETTRAGDKRDLTRDGVQVLAHGALVCPACNLPVSPRPRIAIGAILACGYCDHDAPAREFLTADVYDTVGNEVVAVARLR